MRKIGRIIACMLTGHLLFPAKYEVTREGRKRICPRCENPW